MKDLRQSEYITDIAKEAMIENAKIKKSNKDRIHSILQSLNYDPTIPRYTRKEKKAFTRKIKAIEFPEKKPVVLTKEEYKELFAKQKAEKLERLEARKHISEVLLENKYFYDSVKKEFIKNTKIINKNRSTRNIDKKFIKNAIENFLSTKEEKNNNNENKKKFRYVVQRKSEDNPIKEVDFMTDYIYADTMDDAKKIIKDKATEYKKSDDKFSGIRLIQLKDNNAEGEIYLLPAVSVAA